MTEVVAALIWKGDRFLIAKRPAHKSNALLWEFVGGKAEIGETLEEALVRECREELDVTVAVGKPFFETVHQYPDITVHLTLFSCEIVSGEPKLIEHADMKWILPSELSAYTFCPADKVILERIVSVFGKETTA